MELKLENLLYQQEAVQSVVSVFRGQVRNTIDNACSQNMRTNVLSLTEDELLSNIKYAAAHSGISEEQAHIHKAKDLCIEMETGTGKTLVYIRTILELYKSYGFTKFIILVPSVAIREAVLAMFTAFSKPLNDIYKTDVSCIEYDSKRLTRVRYFAQEQHLQIMVMTPHSFNTDDRILNQTEREDLFWEKSHLEALAHTRPIVIMDEPQEGMDTENAIQRLKDLNPLFTLRYSATHKVFRNLVYRLTPHDSHRQGIVKKIEVHSVVERHIEASMRIEVAQIKLGEGLPKAILKAYHKTKEGFTFKPTKKMARLANLEEVTGNSVYKGYVIDQIAKPIRERGYVEFTNGVKLYEGDQAKPYAAIFSEQLYWLIDTHFDKKEKLKAKGIKCLSLVFIDRVANYIQPEGIIKKAFVEQYKKVHQKHYKQEPTAEQVAQCQGYYFAQTRKGDFTDNTRSMYSDKELFHLIMRDKEQLLRLDTPVEFIFSHSALGVGWDSPNVFNIATLNQSHSDIKKRQEIGRGLRICVNQEGKRVYDDKSTAEGDEINILTVIPNESYTTFVSQYQSEIKEIYGASSEAPELRHTHKGDQKSKKLIKRNDTHFKSEAFRTFWQKMAQKTDYKVSFNDDAELVELSIQAINKNVKILAPKLESTLVRIKDITEEQNIEASVEGSESKKATSSFTAIDLVEEMEKETGLARQTAFKIIQGIERAKMLNNPHKFLLEAVRIIKNIEREELIRVVNYDLTGESFDVQELQPWIIRHTDRVCPTRERGLYDHIVWDSKIERDFAERADSDIEVVCFLKLPPFYVIKTPAGGYNPDFGLVLRREKDSKYYIVIETKGTNDINDRNALTKDEVYKMECAMKHFEALGVDAKYIAPVKEYDTFKDKIRQTNE